VVVLICHRLAVGKVLITVPSHLNASLLRSRFFGMSLWGECCVTFQKTAAKETTLTPKNNTRIEVYSDWPVDILMRTVLALRKKKKQKCKHLLILGDAVSTVSIGAL